MPAKCTGWQRSLWEFAGVAPTFVQPKNLCVCVYCSLTKFGNYHNSWACDQNMFFCNHVACLSLCWVHAQRSNQCAASLQTCRTIVGHTRVQGQKSWQGAQHDRYHCVKWCEPNYPLNAAHGKHATSVIAQKCELHAQLHCTGKHATTIHGAMFTLIVSTGALSGLWCRNDTRHYHTSNSHKCVGVNREALQLHVVNKKPYLFL